MIASTDSDQDIFISDQGNPKKYGNQINTVAMTMDVTMTMLMSGAVLRGNIC